MKFSIVTPNYNCAEHLERAIRSVGRQSGVDVQYIVVDGGSSDASVKIIERYAGQINWWVSERDGGPAAALKKGFGQANGDWFGWVNSDDFLLPNALNTVQKIIQGVPDVQWVSGRRLVIGDSGECLQSGGGWPKNGLNHVIRDAYGLAQEATFFSRTLYESVGGINEECNAIFDRELFLRMYTIERPVFTPAVLGGFQVREGQLSANAVARSADHAIVESLYSRRSIGHRVLHRIAKTRMHGLVAAASNIALQSNAIASAIGLRAVAYDHATRSWRQVPYAKAAHDW